MKNNSEFSVIEKVKSIRPGVFVRIGYKSELPVKSKYKNEGYKVTKYCEFTTRLGIKYSNMESVQKKQIESEDTHIIKRKHNMHWLVEKYILKNDRTDELYLSCYPCCKGRNESIKYKVTNSKTNEDFFCDESTAKNYVNDSYWRKNISNYCCIKLNNITRVGDMVKEDE